MTVVVQKMLELGSFKLIPETWFLMFVERLPAVFAT